MLENQNIQKKSTQTLHNSGFVDSGFGKTCDRYVICLRTKLLYELQTFLIAPSTILDIFHLEENLDEESEEVSIKSVDDILDDKNSLTDSPTNGSIWTKVQDDLENVFGESDLKIGDLVNDKEGDSPKWLDEVDDDIVSLDWHHLMQKFKKTYY